MQVGADESIRPIVILWRNRKISWNCNFFVFEILHCVQNDIFYFDAILQNGMPFGWKSKNILRAYIADFVQKRLDNPCATLYNTSCKFHIAVLCNGSTADSDSVCWGSNPYTAAKKTANRLRLAVFFSFLKRIRTSTYNSNPLASEAPPRFWLV